LSIGEIDNSIVLMLVLVILGVQSNNGGSHNLLNAVTATPSGTLWAVGIFYNNQGIERTLILQKLP
jgi:hypothetical protein